MTTLYLFADTNLFLQYKPLHEIDWCQLGDFADIEIVVCRTVLQEIDALKDGREGRRSSRARRAASTFREIAESGPQEQKAASGRVVLSLYTTLLPKKDLDGPLDYRQPDQRLIGYLAQYMDDYPSADVRLLTGDGGPILTAQMLDMPYESLHDDWRLPPERDDKDREIARLTQQLEVLQVQEPKFEFSSGNQSSGRRGHVEITYDAFRPLTSIERDRLLKRLQNRYPPAAVNRNQIPARVISEYERRNYPAWISECQKYMDLVHSIVQLEQCPELTVTIQNIGSRPATNTLVEIRASENLRLTTPTAVLRDFGLVPVMERPKPPAQPQPEAGLSAILDGLINRSNVVFPDLDFPTHFQSQEDFQYTAEPKLETEPSIGFTCGLWRHSLGPKEFTVRLVPACFDDAITGEVICTVHADNLTIPATFKLVVKLSPNYHPVLEPASKWFTTPHPNEKGG